MKKFLLILTLVFILTATTGCSPKPAQEMETAQESVNQVLPETQAPTTYQQDSVMPGF